MTVTLDYEQQIDIILLSKSFFIWVNRIQLQLYNKMTYRVQEKVGFKVVTSPSRKPIIRNAHRKSYSSYINSEQSKSRNIIMNELNTDIGYPQEILVDNQTKNSQIQSSKNYLRLNIKKIGDYGPEPVRLSKLEPYKQPPKHDTFHILNFKIEQNSLKALTRISLDRDIKVPLSTRSARKLKRMEAALQLNDKVLEIRNTYSNSCTQREPVQRNQNGVHRFTESFYMKRSLTNKKKAYMEVFGDDIGANTISLDQETKNEDHIPSKKQLTRKEVQAAHKSKITNESLKFQQKLTKLDMVDKIFSGKTSKEQINQSIKKKIIEEHSAGKEEQRQQNKMLVQINEFTKRNKDRKFAKIYQNLSSLEDLQKIDPNFFLQLKKYKQDKVFKMKCELELGSLMLTPKPRELRSRSSVDKFRRSLEVSVQEDASKATPPLNQKRSHTKRMIRYMTTFQKIQEFLRAFFRCKQDGDKFGIPIQLMYEAMYSKPQIYQIEGSYLFFRAIEQNDIRTIESIIKIKPAMVFQIDDQGRTPLMYATQKDLLPVVKMLLKVGVNQDVLSFRQVNALYYAIRNKNLKMVFELIYAGASPWSPPGCNLKNLLKQGEEQTFGALLQLARKISIAVKLTKFSGRLNAWKHQKQLIKKLYEQIK